jgi:hypothetical protein
MYNQFLSLMVAHLWADRVTRRNKSTREYINPIDNSLSPVSSANGVMYLFWYEFEYVQHQYLNIQTRLGGNVS